MQVAPQVETLSAKQPLIPEQVWVVPTQAQSPLLLQVWLAPHAVLQQTPLEQKPVVH